MKIVSEQVRDTSFIGMGGIVAEVEIEDVVDGKPCTVYAFVTETGEGTYFGVADNSILAEEDANMLEEYADMQYAETSDYIKYIKIAERLKNDLSEQE